MELIRHFKSKRYGNDCVKYTYITLIELDDSLYLFTKTEQIVGWFDRTENYTELFTDKKAAEEYTQKIIDGLL